ncbi:MAG: hypothetical protein AAB964_01915 [Patescibacteria group bacterium]
MESILHTFGIDWRLLLINAVNFGLLLAGLTYFLYTPVLSMLEERRKRLAEGVAAAAEAEVRLATIEAAKQETLAKAAREADALMRAARATGSKKEHELALAGERRAAAMLAEAEARAKELKERAQAEAKQEVAKLVVLGIEKAFQK